MSLALHLAASRYLRTNSGSAFTADARLTVAKYYNSFFCALGPQRWWLGMTPFKVIVAAILTESRACTNVTQASNNLLSNEFLTARAHELSARERLAELMSPSGYFRQNAKKLKAFVGFLRQDFRGSLLRMFRTPREELRGRQFKVHGMGPDTADSIHFYAGGHPVFVVDA
jgi:endonuclease III related protein